MTCFEPLYLYLNIMQTLASLVQTAFKSRFLKLHERVSHISQFAVIHMVYNVVVGT